MGGRTRQFKDGEFVFVMVDALDSWGNILRWDYYIPWAPRTSIRLAPISQFLGYYLGAEVYSVSYEVNIQNKYYALRGAAAGHFAFRYPWDPPLISPKLAISLITNNTAERDRFYFGYQQDALNNSSPLKNS